jgi:hypothetical protein
MKGLLKLALAGVIAYVVVRIVRQWELDDWLPTVNPLEDSEPSAPEPLQPQDLRVAQNSPL